MPLDRRLGMTDAVVLGMGAMLGAGVFVAFGPAAAAAGAGLPWALGLAAAVAWANADSSARLAALMPTSGGAYAFARERLGRGWSLVAGWTFLAGKTISSGAIATTVGLYLWPEQPRLTAGAAVVVLTALACAGVQRGAALTRVLVGAVVLTLLGVVLAGAAMLPAPAGDIAGVPPAPPGGLGVTAVLQGAGVLFFAFAGYARLATLGEEVRDPRRTIPRAIAVALAAVLVLYGLVGVTLVRTLGLDRLAGSVRPVADAVETLGGSSWLPALGVVAAAAATASCLGVLLALSRTSLAMARDGELPRTLARLRGGAHPTPVVAQVLVGALVVAGIVALDLARAITLSSAAVLVYYAVAHLAALTLPGARRRVVPVLGLAGCVTIAVALLL